MNSDRKKPFPTSLASVLPVALLAIAVLGFIAFAPTTGPLLRQGVAWVSYSTALEKIDSGKVDSAIVDSGRHAMVLQGPAPQPAAVVPQLPPAGWATALPTPTPDALWQALASHKVDVTVVPSAQPSSLSTESLLFGLALGALGFAWLASIAASRRRQQGWPPPFSQQKPKFKPIAPDENKTRLSDLVGCEEARDEASEFIAYLKAPQRYLRVNAAMPRGVLLVGPPGTGKTMLARAIAGEAGVPFFSVSGSDFVEMFVGVGAARVRELFAAARASAPAIIFIDEMDAVGRARSSGRTGGAANDEREQTLNQLLVEMQGFSPREGVIVLAATNRPDILDKALLRPGRFDRRVHLDLPDRAARRAILAAHLATTPVASGVNLDALAAGTPGMSGADLANLVNEAAVRVARRDALLVEQSDLEWARDKVLMGLERKGGIRSARDRRLVAYHEAGHAIVAHFTPHSDPVHKVTIVPRGGSLGLTAFLPNEERLNQDVEDLRAALRGLMGGRAAERVALDTMTAGASNDLARATAIARRMVASWGMDTTLGPIAVDTGEDGFAPSPWSESLRAEVDARVRAEVDSAFDDARRILIERRPLLDAVANALLERETLSAEEFGAMAAERVAPAPPSL